MHWLLGLLLASHMNSGDIVLADFEARDYGSWTTTGTAFGPGPARGTLPNQMQVSGFRGKGLVNSFFGGDGPTGTLTSPPFRIERRNIKFLIGGGKDPSHLSLNLIVSGQTVRQATGPNDRPGGSEALHQEGWDVRDLMGQEAKLEIVDRAIGGWGHINVDDIIMTDQPIPTLLDHPTRTIRLNKRFLMIPIQNGAPKRKVTMAFEGGPQVTNDVEIADGKPDWWTALDVSQYMGKKLTITLDHLSSDSKGLKSIKQGDTVPRAYNEALRGQFHFSPRRGWMNDPNGLCYFNGEYHMFFQHNPYGWSWGNMHWGHAVSKDLVHWEELPEALMPDDMGTIFSGSAVVDVNNTSGLGKPGKPAMVLFYTSAGTKFTQCLAYTLDGRTFHKYAGNPIIGQITDGNRDPKVIWYEPEKKWVMVLYVERPPYHTIEFFSSKDLIHWTYMSSIQNFYECPDLFELPVEGTTEKKWILTAADSDYMVGSFDGHTFTPETTKLKGNQGIGFYAAQTFSNMPDGRRVQVGWFQTETKGMPFNQSMSVPMELTLQQGESGYQIMRQPVKEMNLSSPWYSGGIIMHPAFAGDKLTGRSDDTTRLELQGGGFTPIIINIRGLEMTYTPKDGMLACQGKSYFVGLSTGRGGTFQTYLIDRNGIEIFSEGRYIPLQFQPGRMVKRVSVENTDSFACYVSIRNIKSIWQPAKP